MAKSTGYITAIEAPKTLLLAAYYSPECQLDYENYVAEFFSLAKTAKIKDELKFIAKMRNVLLSTFLTKGKLAELVSLCQQEEVKRIICSQRLSPNQKRNLEDLTGSQIWDRSDLILEIFRLAATSAEGRLQVKMAEIELQKTRLSGLGEGMGQQQSGAMARGPGETHKEFVKRFYKKVVAQAKKELDALNKVRQTQRERRLNAGKPIFAIVGYTNAGKSSLINALTGSEVLVEDKLFATLDTTTKELYLAPKVQVLISDTIGFISDIPHNLIAAFKSTLDELHYADFLLHVIDLSNPAWADQINVVHQTLEEINVIKPMGYIFNKIDALKPEELQSLQQQIELSGIRPILFISVKQKLNLDELKQFLKQLAKKKQPVVA